MIVGGYDGKWGLQAFQAGVGAARCEAGILIQTLGSAAFSLDSRLILF